MFSPQLVPLLGEVVEGLDGELSHLGNTPLEVILGPQSCLLSLLCVLHELKPLLQQASTTGCSAQHTQPNKYVI